MIANHAVMEVVEAETVVHAVPEEAAKVNNAAIAHPARKEIAVKAVALQVVATSLKEIDASKVVIVAHAAVAKPGDLAKTVNSILTGRHCMSWST